MKSFWVSRKAIMINQRYNRSRSFTMMWKNLFCWSLIFIFQFLPCKAYSRENILTGSISALQWFDSNIDRTNQDERSEWTTTLSPEISISSAGQHDTLAFIYSPEFSLNNRTEKGRVDHYLSLDGNKEFKKITINLHETFIRSEDPVEDEEREINISDKRGKSRYWTNAVDGQMGYIFAKDSIFSVGYSNYILNNDDQSAQDYVKHTPFASLSYSFSTRWNTVLSYSYTNGNFDEGEDLDTNDASIRLANNFNATNSVYGNFSYSTTHYRGPSEDYYILTPTVGGSYAIDPKTSLTAEIGVSFTKRDISSDEENLTYIISLDRQIDRGSISLAGQGGFDQLQFNGTPEDGLSKYWAISATLSYQLLKELESQIYSGYRQDKFIERISDEKEQFFDAGINLTYSFLQWYSFSVDYSYGQLEADNPADDYDVHRVYFRISAAKDLLKW